MHTHFLLHELLVAPQLPEHEEIQRIGCDISDDRCTRMLVPIAASGSISSSVAQILYFALKKNEDISDRYRERSGTHQTIIVLINCPKSVWVPCRDEEDVRPRSPDVFAESTMRARIAHAAPPAVVRGDQRLAAWRDAERMNE